MVGQDVIRLILDEFRILDSIFEWAVIVGKKPNNLALLTEHDSISFKEIEADTGHFILPKATNHVEGRSRPVSHHE